MHHKALHRLPRHFLGFAALAAVGLGMALPAHAEALVSLEAGVKVERTEMHDGVAATVLAEPTNVVPGDRLLFSTAWRNDSAEAVENFVVTNPLPGAVVLAADDSAFEVSVDGGAHFAPLASLTITDEAAATRPAEPRDVTHIRWTLARIEPGSSGLLSYSAFVR